MSSADFRFVPIEEQYDCSDFDCGEYAVLTNHLRAGYALRDEIADRTRTYLLLSELPEVTSASAVVGFFSLEAGIVPTKDVPREAWPAHLGLPAELPAVYLGMIARHKEDQGQGLGNLLMIEALRRSVFAGSIIGAVGVYAVAISPESYKLMTNFGFYDLEGETFQYGNRMFLPMAAARALLNTIL